MEHEHVKEASRSMEKAAETLSDTVLAIMDKLAGKQSDLKLSFQDLTLEMGMMKTRINGSVVLDLVYSKDAEK
jgi:hypothetical protein